jgi:3-hydroxyisobutyrate dehydrogenase
MKIGWIGTGIMGASMAGHLQFAGHELFLFSRTRDKAKPLIDRGGRWCPTPAAVAAEAEIAFTMVGMPTDVEETYLGPQGILAGDPKCRIVVDMTTSEPAQAKRIAQAASKKNIASLDAPVSGGDVGARNATLAIMVGGDRKVYEEVLPLFQHMGKTIAWMGGPGAGQHTKMCNQILAGTRWRKSVRGGLRGRKPNYPASTCRENRRFSGRSHILAKTIHVRKHRAVDTTARACLRRDHVQRQR